MNTRPTRAAILALTQCLPHPPHSGVTNRIYHILQGLQERFDVFLVPFARRHHQPTEEAIRASHAALSRELTWVAPQASIAGEHHRSRRMLDHLAGLLTGHPWIRYEYAARDFGRGMKAALARRAPALVHAESLDLYGWLDDLPPVPLSVTHHNIESDLLMRRATTTRARLVREYIALQARRVEATEREWAPRVALNVMMSDIDAERLESLAPGARTMVVPNGVDVEYFSRRLDESPDPLRIAFIGPTYMFPNRQAVDWFLDECWARVRQEIPGLNLDLVGGAKEPDAKRYAGIPGVRVRGHVLDVRPFLQAASCAIVPIRVGGGTRLKILDAWAMGTPVVSTAVGCEGLDTRDGENILIRDEPAAFAEAVVGLMRDPARADQIGRAGRATAESRYSWRQITNRLADRYVELIG
jgi:glycosyltransferase involved in cell wall biosynthesis